MLCAPAHKHRVWSETLMQQSDLDVMTICQNPLAEIGNNGGR